MYGLRLIANRITGPGLLQFTAYEDIQVYVHATNEVPFGTEGEIKENVFYGSQKEIIVKVTEMVNDHSVEDISIELRKCRFSWERSHQRYRQLYKFYSHSTCAIECSREIQLRLCNCTHHLMPNGKGNHLVQYVNKSEADLTGNSYVFKCCMFQTISVFVTSTV